MTKRWHSKRILVGFLKGKESGIKKNLQLGTNFYTLYDLQYVTLFTIFKSVPKTAKCLNIFREQSMKIAKGARVLNPELEQQGNVNRISP